VKLDMVAKTGINRSNYVTWSTQKNQVKKHV